MGEYQSNRVKKSPRDNVGSRMLRRRWLDYEDEDQGPESRRQGPRRESSQVGALTRPAANNHSKQSVRGGVAWSEVNLSEVPWPCETAETSWSLLTRELNQLSIICVHEINVPNQITVKKIICFYFSLTEILNHPKEWRYSFLPKIFGLQLHTF